MAIGDIDFVRVPIVVDPNGLTDSAVVNAAAALFTPTNYDSITMVIVPGEGINSTKQVLVIAGRRLT